MSSNQSKNDKLRNALRNNLRKRKSQARRLGQTDENGVQLRSRLISPAGKKSEDDPPENSGDQ